MKKRLASISLTAALLVSCLSTAGMSVSASAADTASTTSSTSVNYKDAIGNIADQFKEQLEDEVTKEIISGIADKIVSKLFSTTTTTTAPTTTTTTTAATSATSATESTAATTATSAAESTTATTVTSATTTETTTSGIKDFAQKILDKLASKKYSKVTVEDDAITVYKGHYNRIKTTGQGKISYYSTDESIATVDGDGIVKGVSEGKTKIIVVAWGNDEYHPSVTQVDVTVNTSILDGLFGN